MKQKFSTFRNEDGSTVVITLLILVALTLTGISAITTSSIDIQIAANDKLYKIALHNADSGVFAVPKVISRTVNEGTTPGNIGGEVKTFDAFTYQDLGTNDNDGSSLPSDSTFFKEVFYDTDYDPEPDIVFTLNNNDISVDVQRLPAVQIGGGGAEFLSGYEGIGTSSSGSVVYPYIINSLGRAQNNTQANVSVVYLKLIGVPGGL